MGDKLRHLGHELQRLYLLRQKADYEAATSGRWDARIADPRFVDIIAEAGDRDRAGLGDTGFQPASRAVPHVT